MYALNEFYRGSNPCSLPHACRWAAWAGCAASTLITAALSAFSWWRSAAGRLRSVAARVQSAGSHASRESAGSDMAWQAAHTKLAHFHLQQEAQAAVASQMWLTRILDGRDQVASQFAYKCRAVPANARHLKSCTQPARHTSLALGHKELPCMASVESTCTARELRSTEVACLATTGDVATQAAARMCMDASVCSMLVNELLQVDQHRKNVWMSHS
jgi:hypothetical protein